MSKDRTLLYKPRQMTVPFPGRLEDHYCKDEGNYGPKFTKAYGASLINNTIPRKEKDPGSFTLPCFINYFCFDNALVDLGASISVMPLSTYLNLGLGELAHTRLMVELADRTVKYPKGIAENVLVGMGKFTFPIDFIILDMPEDIKVLLILERPFLSTAHAKIDVYKRNITLRVREEKIIFKRVKPTSSIIKRVYMLSLRERMELDLEARLMGETLVLNRSLDPFSKDYIELIKKRLGQVIKPNVKLFSHFLSLDLANDLTWSRGFVSVELGRLPNPLSCKTLLICLICISKVLIEAPWFLMAISVEARISLIMFEFSSCLLADSAMNLVSDSSRLGLRSGYEEFPLFRR
ncbi:hypothetical protein Tco_0714147 [Tanacetum coccineum]